MNLAHYSHTPITYVRSHPMQGSMPMFKPVGFWVSVDDSNKSWPDFAHRQNYTIGSIRHSVKLKEDAKPLLIESIEELVDFTEKYGERFFGEQHINWQLVEKEYPAVIITPWRYDYRKHRSLFWYGSWDCASGCIWDASIVEEITITHR